MILYRLRAALAAFRDPRLVGEAKSMRNTIEDFEIRQQCGILSGQRIGNELHPQITVINYPECQRLREWMLS